MTALMQANRLFNANRDWSRSVAMAALRRLGPRVDGQEVQQVADFKTWGCALRFDPSLWTITPTKVSRESPASTPFQLFAYRTVYGGCLRVGLRGMAGRSTNADGSYIAFDSMSGRSIAVGNASPERGPGWTDLRQFAEDKELPVAPNQDAVEVQIDSQVRRRLISAVLADLPKRERHIIAEHYLAGATLAAIAESLYTSPATISRIHAGALGLLRQAVARRGYSAGML